MKKITNPFDMNRPGRGISKSHAASEDTTGLFGFFRMFKTRFWNISTMNMLFVLINFPIFFGIAALSGNFDLQTTAPSSPLYAPIYGMAQFEMNPFISAILSVIGEGATIYVPSTVTKILAAMTGLTVFTFGLANVGATYLVRGFVRGEPIYVGGDFFGAIKRNWKQGIIMGILDCIFLLVFAYGLMTYYINAGTYALNVMFFAELFLFITYLTMRFYMYLMLITFDLSVFKILKNSFILAIVGFKRNFFAWLGIILVLILNFYLLFTLPFLGVIVPLLITCGALMTVSAYAVYPVIKKYMIDPVSEDDGNGKASAVEQIFTDRG